MTAGSGWCDLWVRETPDGNPYAHPVSGLKVLVDMNTLELLEIEDQYDVGMPAVDGEYVPGPWKGELRTDLQAPAHHPARGRVLHLDGTELRWQNWSMRLGFNYREGPVIYQLAYDDHGVRRDIAYRMSFAEMVVPYRDPTFDHYRRTAYDIGEWGLGFMTTSLELGCDCLGEIAYVGRGAARRRGRAVRHQERDLLARGGQRRPLEARSIAVTGAEVRRQRRMVVSVPRHRRELRVPRLLALLPGRQHRVRGTRDRHHGDHPLCRGRGRAARTAPSSTTAPTRRSISTSWSPASTLTSTVSANTVVEVDSVAPPVSDENPYGLALVTQSTPITSEASSARDYNWDTQRGWKVVNPDKLNRHGTPVAYKLVPGAAFPAIMDPRRRSTFGRRSSATRCGSRGTTTTSAGRAASTRRSPPLTPV